MPEGFNVRDYVLRQLLSSVRECLSGHSTDNNPADR